MLQPRPPIVVFLGHVDHGKTSLLDSLRQTDTASREIGGITQSVSAFQLRTQNSEIITFIDTPGHAAFAQMRSRGSQLADLAVLVVAADAGVMPQTRESLDFIAAAGLPLVVAINKVDLATSQPEKVKGQLLRSGVALEGQGGQVPVVAVSAKTGQGLADLLEVISLVVGLNPPQADPAGGLAAVVLESRLDSRRGPVAIVIVKNGTVACGQTLYLAQQLVGKVRRLTDAEGRRIDQALPSTPVEILGLSVVPPVGSLISSSPPPTASRPLVNSSPSPKSGALNLVLKADNLGSLEAITNSLAKTVGVVARGTGDVAESDVLLAQSTGSQIISYNVGIPTSVAKLAEIEGVKIATYRLIYELLDAVDEQVRQIEAGPAVEKPRGRAEIVAEFQVDSSRVAGCRCLEGKMGQSDSLVLTRGDQKVGQAGFKSLRVGKTNVAQIKSGQEFGAIFSPNLDFKVGDHIMALAHGPS